MGCASSAMEAVNKLAANFKEPDVVTAEELVVPRLGLRYSNDDGLPPGVVPSADKENNDEVESECTETTTTKGESGKSIYSTAMATQLVAKTLAQRREELINSFNTILSGEEDGSSSSLKLSSPDSHSSMHMDRETTDHNKEKESLMEMEKEDVEDPSKLIEEAAKTVLENNNDNDNSNNNKPDVVKGAEEEEQSLESKMQQEMKSENKTISSSNKMMQVVAAAAAVNRVTKRVKDVKATPVEVIEDLTTTAVAPSAPEGVSSNIVEVKEVEEKEVVINDNESADD